MIEKFKSSLKIHSKKNKILMLKSNQFKIINLIQIKIQSSMINKLKTKIKSLTFYPSHNH